MRRILIDGGPAPARDRDPGAAAFGVWRRVVVGGSLVSCVGCGCVCVCVWRGEGGRGLCVIGFAPGIIIHILSMKQCLDDDVTL